MKTFINNLLSDSTAVLADAFCMVLAVSTACICSILIVILNRDMVSGGVLVSALIAFATAGHVVKSKIKTVKKE
jgi:hypothetical protein